MRPPAAYKTKTEMGNAFIFDFDGTLAETIPLTLAAIRSAYADNGLPAPSESEIVANFGSNEFGMFAKMTPECAEKLFESYVSQYRALHAKYAPEPFAGIGGILRKIKNAGWKLGLVTGKHRRTAEASLDFYGINGIFDGIRCGGLNGSVKPENISSLLREWGRIRAAHGMSATSPKTCSTPGPPAYARSARRGQKQNFRISRSSKPCGPMRFSEASENLKSGRIGCSTVMQRLINNNFIIKSNK